MHSHGDHPLRVLYIDDDVALVRLVQRHFSRLGVEILHAVGLEDARAIIATGDVSAIALDHYLPSGTGLELLSQLTEFTNLPIVYVTGSTDTNVAVGALKSGASDFVAKTASDDFLELLWSALEQSMEKARLVAERQAAEHAVRQAKDKAEMLLREVNHRVANSLSLVNSMVNLQINALEDGAARSALVETQARIYAVAMVHKRLYTSDAIGVVSLNIYLEGIVENLGKTMASEDGGIQLVSSLDNMECTTDRAIKIGIIVTEWVTNAHKYAYPSGTGEIRVVLREREGGTGELRVEDDGVGLNPDASPQGTGLGSRLVTAMARSIQAEVKSSEPGPGTVFQLSFAPRGS